MKLAYIKHNSKYFVMVLQQNTTLFSFFKCSTQDNKDCSNIPINDY